MTLDEFLVLAEQSAPYEPCVGSGYCCKKVVCWEGLRAFGSVAAPCPALRKTADRYVCGLYVDADGEEKERIASSLHIGAGCCSNMNTDHRDIVRQLMEENRERKREVRLLLQPRLGSGKVGAPS